ncbi:PH domain-containing protein [Candidatus Berkiella aquae]|uniref:Bacterial membrane flanked domain protein n=1 Tax=Candidatus Berkiella aquae TaxID=295108 RepID=A0A0Q9YXC7_9GAMM|nr:PH domain-containing protein [Candidatus Berkiella aquae]MCS5711564.1 PH domain-containing protein [Candidatus Berkiella aquae]
MSYVDSHLLPNEKVVHRTHLHKIMFFWPGVLACAMFAAGVWILMHPAYRAGFAGLCFVVGVAFLLAPYIQYISSEFAVTNKRVIIKVGFISRQTLETLLQKVEAIGVDQTVLGRILNYGSITITGTGGTRESFYNIVDPLAFRRAVQEESDTSNTQTNLN